MRSEGAVNGQLSAISSGAADPLADAHCTQCGYSLRGLPENRCPECGRAFDPAEILASFRPKWPLLMKWFILAHVIGGAVRSPFVIASLPTFASTQASSPLVAMNVFPHLARDVAFVLLGTVAAVGLHRGREWGRKLALAVFACAGLSWILPAPLAMIFYTPAVAGGLPDLVLYGLSQWATALPLLLVVLFLATGLRRHSLARPPDAEAPRLHGQQFSPQKDWPLLVVIIVAGTALVKTWSVIGCWNMFRYALKQGYPGGGNLCLAAIFVVAAAAGWLWLSAMLLRRRPQAVRGLLVINLVALVLALVGQGAADYLAFPSPTPLVNVVARGLLWSMVSLLTQFSLLIFAFRDLTENDVRLVDRSRRRQ